MNKLFLIWYCWVIITCVFKLYFYIRIMRPFPIRAILTSYKTSFKVKASSWCICVQAIASTTEWCRLCNFLRCQSYAIYIMHSLKMKLYGSWIMEHGPRSQITDPDCGSQTQMADHRPGSWTRNTDHIPRSRISDPDRRSQTQIADHRPGSQITDPDRRSQTRIADNRTVEQTEWLCVVPKYH